MKSKLPWSGTTRDLTVWSLLTASILASYCAAFVLRLGLPASTWAPWFGEGLFVVLATKLTIFSLYRVHRGLWRYAGLGDLVVVGQATFTSGIVLITLSIVLRAPEWLAPVAILDTLLTGLTLAGVRVLPRMVSEFLRRPSDHRRALIIGAGDAGEALVRELKRSLRPEMIPVAIVDDDPEKIGRSVHGVRVVGAIEGLAHAVQDARAEVILVAIGALSRERAREIRATARETGLPVKGIPSLDELLHGRAGISELRDFTLEELLEREPIRTDHAAVAQLVSGRCVLVTGAAGSIGSEMSRQLAGHGPDKLLLLDVNENALFDMQCELCDETTESGCETILCNIRDEVRLEEIFRKYRPDVVFHAAAYKHVPVLESYPEEAVRNNVHGTRNLARLADRYGAERFVLISTDKAVRPSSIMGTTKRVAELIVGDLDARSRTQFTTLRFGNVLGSNGSVMQIFRRQIARGGPVTVTHPEMRRYFMSIPEAVELVLFAAAMDESGGTYILDMGEQVRILDMARHYIRLCGLEPGRDIEITYTGLRPGEKLYEELWTAAEEPEETAHPSILQAPRDPGALPTDLDARVATLVQWAEECDRREVVSHLRALVPEYSGDPIALRTGGSARPAAKVLDLPEKKRQGVELSVIEGVVPPRERHDDRVPAARGR